MSRSKTTFETPGGERYFLGKYDRNVTPVKLSDKAIDAFNYKHINLNSLLKAKFKADPTNDKETAKALEVDGVSVDDKLQHAAQADQDALRKSFEDLVVVQSQNVLKNSTEDVAEEFKEKMQALNELIVTKSHTRKQIQALYEEAQKVAVEKIEAVQKKEQDQLIKFWDEPANRAHLEAALGLTDPTEQIKKLKADSLKALRAHHAEQLKSFKDTLQNEKDRFFTHQAGMEELHRVHFFGELLEIEKNQNILNAVMAEHRAKNSRGVTLSTGTNENLAGLSEESVRKKLKQSGGYLLTKDGNKLSITEQDKWELKISKWDVLGTTSGLADLPLLSRVVPSASHAAIVALAKVIRSSSETLDLNIKYAEDGVGDTKTKRDRALKMARMAYHAAVAAGFEPGKDPDNINLTINGEKVYSSRDKVPKEELDRDKDNRILILFSADELEQLKTMHKSAETAREQTITANLHQGTDEAAEKARTEAEQERIKKRLKDGRTSHSAGVRGDMERAFNAAEVERNRISDPAAGLQPMSTTADAEAAAAVTAAATPDPNPVARSAQLKLVETTAETAHTRKQQLLDKQLEYKPLLEAYKLTINANTALSTLEKTQKNAEVDRQLTELDGQITATRTAVTEAEARVQDAKTNTLQAKTNAIQEAKSTIMDAYTELHILTNKMLPMRLKELDQGLDEEETYAYTTMKETEASLNLLVTESKALLEALGVREEEIPKRDTLVRDTTSILIDTYRQQQQNTALLDAATKRLDDAFRANNNDPALQNLQDEVTKLSAKDTAFGQTIDALKQRLLDFGTPVANIPQGPPEEPDEPEAGLAPVA